MKNVLILEDDNANLGILAALLRSKDLNVFTATTALEALNIAQDQRWSVDLLVADVRLKGALSGPDAAVALAHRVPSVQILFVTGLPFNDWDEHDRMSLGLLPPDGVVLLEKPFFPATFENLVENLLMRATPLPEHLFSETTSPSLNPRAR